MQRCLSCIALKDQCQTWDILNSWPAQTRRNDFRNQRFFAFDLLPVCLSWYALSTSSRPSFRRASNITSSTDTVERPACLRKEFSILWSLATTFDDLLRKAFEISADILCHKANIQQGKWKCASNRQDAIPICVQTISVKAPINCGVAFTPSLRVSSSTILPIENHSADLRRCISQSVNIVIVA